MAKALSSEQIKQHLADLPGWEHVNDMLSKTYEFSSYLAGVAFASAVGTISEGMDHHPDMTILWRKVTVSYTTHDADSKVTEKDVKAAKAVEALGYPKG